LATEGKGQQFRYVGKYPLYTEPDLDAWIEAQLSAPVQSTKAKPILSTKVQPPPDASRGQLKSLPPSKPTRIARHQASDEPDFTPDAA
jgi:hypothetical protein